MARNIITGIDAGSSRIKVMVAEEKGDGCLNVLGLSQKISKGIRRGYITDFEEAAESTNSAIKAAEKAAAAPIKNACVAVGGVSMGSVKSKGQIMVSRADGTVSEYDIKRVIDQCEANIPNFANKQILHEIPLYFKVDGNVVLGQPSGMKGSKLEAETLFVNALTQHLSEMVKAVESAGVRVNDIVASPLAAGLAALSKHQKEAGCVLANIGAGTVSIVVFEEGKPISLEVFPIGSTHITNDIALGMQIPIEEAERIKIEYGAGNAKKQLSNIIEARLNDIFELIESHLKKINRNRLLPAGIILTGGGSCLFSLEDIAKASLHLPAKVATPVDAQNIGAKIIGAYKDQVVNDPGWSVALGLCLMELKGKVPEKHIFKGDWKMGTGLKKLFRLILP